MAWKLLNFKIVRSARNFKRAKRVAALDKYLSSKHQRQFQLGTRPVIRWIKGDGLDDEVTRAAIAHATRLFGQEVDYCLITQGIEPDRARNILSWAEQSVEWWPITEEDNPELAEVLKRAGCPKEDFGYWWKWFPERVRINAPEWILDGDMFISGRPEWFDTWKKGKDPIRVTENNEEELYGEYSAFVDKNTRLYSGLISLPPRQTYMTEILNLFDLQPLKGGHNGTRNPSEQGVIASVFQRLKALPIPLHEFPFAMPWSTELNYGVSNERSRVWGYHFARSFVTKNPHFERLVSEGSIITKTAIDIAEKYQWLSGGIGQWGIPGYGARNDTLKLLASSVNLHSNGKALDLGTSRGRIAAVLADLGYQVTTVDHIDRGASINLKDLDVEVIVDDAINFLKHCKGKFDLIVVDVHDNSIEVWRKLWLYLPEILTGNGKILINNYNLHDIPEWKDERGVGRMVELLNNDWSKTILSNTTPGLVLLERNE
jgi:SAM-dependent methyltransferase